jgi:hypothetical protein
VAADLTIKANDLGPITRIAEDAVGPVDLDGATALFRMVNVLDGTTKVNKPASVAASLPFTVSGATLTSNDHGLNNGESVTLKTTGTLPVELNTQTNYYVVNATANTLKLALQKGGTAIATTGAGTGTHSLLSGRLTYDREAEDVDRAGTYFGEFQVTNGGEPSTYPNDGQLLIEVISDLA